MFRIDKNVAPFIFTCCSYTVILTRGTANGLQPVSQRRLPAGSVLDLSGIKFPLDWLSLPKVASPRELENSPISLSLSYVGLRTRVSH